ncbi:MAG: outer membrane protein transport protein [Smithella sp.]|jgi:long-subunit fatty acid transport protein
MTEFLKITTFIAHLPLSVFFLFPNKKHKFNNLKILRTFCIICFITVAISLIKLPSAQAAFMESIAIDPEAIALANTVTANPPGIASIHYNPAGLSLLGDGNYISMGALPVFLKKTSRFKQNNDYEEFHDFEGNTIHDSLNGKEGTSTGQMYLPILDTTLDALAAPVFGVSHRSPGSKWTFAYSTYVPYAGGWKGDDDDPSRYGGQSVYLQHLIYAAPAVSYRVNNNLSIGASFALGQTAMGASMDARAPNEIVNITKVLGDATQGMSTPIFDLTIPMPLFGGGLGPYDDIGKVSFAMRDDFSPSFNLGVLWEPFDWLAFGVSYNSPVKVNLSGRYSIQYSDDFQNMVAWSGSTAIMQIISMVFDLPYEATAEQTGAVETEMEFPQMVNFGIKVKPTKRLSLMADGHWANWSCVKDNNLVFDQKIQLLQLSKFMGYAEGSYNIVMKRDLKDTLNWSVGAEYQLLDWLALRAGYENRTASTQDLYYDLLYALPTVDYYGAGLGIKWNNIDIDLALGYLVNKSYKLRSDTSVNMNSEILGSGFNNPYRGLDYEQETSFIVVGAKLTMPLEIVTGMLFSTIDMVTPARFKSAKKTAEIKGPVDSSSAIIDNMRFDGKYYYTEDSE